jgi:hypothetical protein
MELFGKVYIVINVERKKGKEINIIYFLFFRVAEGDTRRITRDKSCVNTWLVINGRKMEQK